MSQLTLTTTLDTHLEGNNPTTNFGAQTFLNVGYNIAARRALVQFDVSALPANATIISAVLHLWVSGDASNNADTVRAFRLKRAWVEAEATWNIWATAQNWQTAGGFGANDCEQTDIGALALPAAVTDGQEFTWALTPAAVQEWRSGVFTNRGLLLKTDTESGSNLKQWKSREHATVAQRPQLVITYLAPEAPSATGDQPGYDLTLSDGTATLGIMAGGAGGPAVGAIRRLPRGPGVERKVVEQNDWTGGRGNARFSADRSRFYDASGVWSMVPGQVTSGPLLRLGKSVNFGPLRGYGEWPGDLDANGNLMHQVRWKALTGANRFIATKLTANAVATNVLQVRVVVRRVGAPAGNAIVSLRADSGGAPGSVIASGEAGTGTLTDWLAVLQEFQFGGGTQTLVNGTSYWVSVGDKDGTGTASDHWEVLWVEKSAGTAAANISTDGSSWSAAADPPPSLVYRLDQGHTNASDVRYLLFEYKRQLYAASRTSTNTGAVYMNGDRGVCTGTQAAGKIVDTTKAWTTNEWRGCVAQVLNGANQGEALTINSNTATELVLEANWSVTPTTGASGTEYVILGSDRWEVRSVPTLNAGATDVAVLNDIVYVACGGAVNMTRFREYNNAGAWTVEEADDGTNKCLFIEVFQEGETVYLYHASGARFNKAAAVTWPTNLSLDSSKPVGDAGALITGLTIYDDSVYIAKEDALYVVKNGIATLVPVPINTARDLNNGVGLRGWNTNLYFPFLDGFERLFGRTCDDIGPNRQEGMPPDRRGNVADFLPVLQYGFVAWDGGSFGTNSRFRHSAILVTTSPGGDWHELLRYPRKNYRIQNLFYQSIPKVPNRLWFSLTDTLNSLVMPNSAQNPLNDDQMLYTWEGYVTTAWVDLDTPELDHYFDELRLFSRNLSVATGAALAVDYQLDAAEYTSAWVRFPLDATISPYQLLAVGDGNVTGHRLRFRLRLLAGDLSVPVVLNEWEARINQMNEVLYDYVIDLRIADRVMLLSGGESTKSAQAIIVQLQAWQEDATPLTMRCRHEAFDNVRGHIDPVSLVPQKWTGEEALLLGSLTFKQT